MATRDVGEVQTNKTQAVTLRVPREVYEAVKTFAFATDASINDVFLRAVHSFLTSEGRQEQVEGLLDRARGQYRVALDKLADL